MKSSTTTKLSSSHKLPSSSSTRNSKPSKPPETNPRSRPSNPAKENLDSKTSTQDRTHKLDSPQAQLKDISNIALSESLLCAEPKQETEHNLSGLSIINMLDKDRPDLLQDILNFDLPDDNDTVKRELEMKNRLIEKLMKENSSLREEMEGLLSTIDEVKIPSSTHSQDYNNRLLELEHQIVHLEGENRSLREEVQKNSEQFAEKEARIRQFELQIQRYYETTKESMDMFYSKFTEQVQQAMEFSQQKYQDCLKNICPPEIKDQEKQKIPEIKIPTERMSASTKSVEIQLNKSGVKKASLLSLDRRVSTDEGLSCSTGRMSASARGSMTPKPGLYSKRGLTESSYSSTRALNTCSAIDENAELSGKDRRKSTMSFRGLAGTGGKNIKKEEDGGDTVTPSNRKSMNSMKTMSYSGVKDNNMAKSAPKGRVSMGATTTANEKKK